MSEYMRGTGLVDGPQFPPLVQIRQTKPFGPDSVLDYAKKSYSPAGSSSSVIPNHQRKWG